MPTNLPMLSLCIVSLLMSACVSKSKYATLESDLSQNLTHLQTTASAQQAAEQARDRCRTQFATLQSSYNERVKENTELAQDLKERSATLAALESTVEKQNFSSVLQRKIEQELKDKINMQEVKIESIEDKLKVTFVDKILFDLGSTVIKPAGRATLLQIANSLKDEADQLVMVEGHTDNLTIRSNLKARFPSNWELSAARATSVVRFLQDQGNLDPTRLSATGRSYYKPVASNETPDGREQNRRIEIILAPSR